MSNQKCCVPGCSNSAGSSMGSSSEVLHKFPNPAKNNDRFKTWLYAVGGEILGLENDHIFKYRRICQIHFEEKYWCRNNRLSNVAVPTKHMPGIPLTKNTYCARRPLRSIDNMSEASTSKDPVTLYSVASEINTMSDKNKNMVEPVSESPSVDSLALQPFSQSAKDDTKRKDNYVLRTGRMKVVRKRKLCSSISEENLRRKLIQVGIKLSKCRSQVKKQAMKIKAMQDILSHPEFLKTLDNLSSTAKILILLQFREHKKGMRGRRFTLEEKIRALSIYKQSPKGYRFFRKIFILPSPQILGKLLSLADIKPGINKNIFSQIQKATKKMKIEDRICMVLFDEMALKPNLAYNERKDRVSGFVTNGTETLPEFADHAQVFMIRGLVKNYKQPVAYTFSQAATKGPELAKQLKEIISELQKAGLIVVATVCDQGTNNVHCIKRLMQETHAFFLRKGEEFKNNAFLINDQEIIPLYDPPHLIKCIRNNLLTKNLKYVKNNKECTAKWCHILDLHGENPGYRGIRLVPKLTDYHCIPSKIPKQKVKYATQVFSQTVGINMGYLSDKGILASECKETADILIFFDRLFDSVNGSYGKRKKHAKPLLGPVTPTSTHHQVWEESKKMLKNMKFIKNSKVEHVPTLKNWVWTLEGIEHLLKNMCSKYKINSLWLRHLNQDPIENFFGSIRSHGCRNVNPSPEKFESAYSTLLVNSLSSVHAPGANCESDNCHALSTIIITESGCKEPSVCDLENIPDITITPIEEKASDPRKIGGLQYVSGYIIKNVKKNVFKGCKQCKEDLMTDNESEYIKYREYTNKKWLCSPSDSLLVCISSLQDIIYTIIKTNLEKKYLKELIKTIIFLYIDFNFVKCELHKEEIINYLLQISCRFFIYNYCKEINKILTNKRECDDDDDLLKIKAKKYFVKCFKTRRPP